MSADEANEIDNMPANLDITLSEVNITSCPTIMFQMGTKNEMNVQQFYWKTLTEDSDKARHWSSVVTGENLKYFTPTVDEENHQLLLKNDGVTLVPSHERSFSKSWRLTFGYYRIALQEPSSNPRKNKRITYITYNLLLLWDYPSGDTYLCLEVRGDKVSCFSTGSAQWERIPKTQIEFLPVQRKLVHDLITPGGFNQFNKLNIWNNRFKTKFTKTTGSDRTKPTSALIHYSTSLNLLDSNPDFRASKTLQRFKPKSGSMRCKALPNSPMSSRNNDIDIYRDGDLLKGFFAKSIPAEKLVATIQALDHLIIENVQGVGLRELDEADRNLLVGALADRLYSHVGWNLEPKEPIVEFNLDDVHFDIDQVAFEIDDMGNSRQMRNFWEEFFPKMSDTTKTFKSCDPPIINPAWKKRNKISPLTLFGCLQNIDEEIKAKVEHSIPVMTGILLSSNVGFQWKQRRPFTYIELSGHYKSYEFRKRWPHLHDQ